MTLQFAGFQIGLIPVEIKIFLNTSEILLNLFYLLENNLFLVLYKLWDILLCIKPNDIYHISKHFTFLYKFSSPFGIRILRFSTIFKVRIFVN